MEMLNLRYAVLTLDREGICLVCADGRARQFETRSRSVTDVAGAGDMVLSLLGLALASGWSIDDAVRLANVGAGIEVSKVGVTPVERWELEQALEDGSAGIVSKVRSLEEVVRIADRARAADCKVVFTNGCFDILHSGHVYLLEKARALGDLLIVGMNSDRSVSRLKGEDRPILSGEERALVLSSLTAVDHIIFFEEDTPHHLIEVLRPDVLVKGSEYRDGIVVGREIVEEAGGRVEFVPILPDVSTTSILERIRKEGHSSPRRDG